MSFCEICTIGLAWPPVCGTDVEACRAAKGFVWIETDGELAVILGFFMPIIGLVSFGLRFLGIFNSGSFLSMNERSFL